MTVKTLPAHGTLSRHKHYGCKCDPCAEYYLAWQRTRHRKVAYGTWQPYVDVVPVRQHVASLVAAGCTIRSIEQAARVSTVQHILYGPSKGVRTETAQKLLALRASDLAPSTYRSIDATGTRRRIQALVATGWPLTHIARHLGMHPRRLTDFSRAEFVSRATAARVAACYRRLSTLNPATQGVPQNQITTARRIAEARNWAGPLDWDDNIDDPTALPDTGGTLAKLPTAEVRAEEIRHLSKFGIAPEDIAERLDVTASYVRDQLRGARLPGSRSQRHLEAA